MKKCAADCVENWYLVLKSREGFPNKAKAFTGLCILCPVHAWMHKVKEQAFWDTKDSKFCSQAAFQQVWNDTNKGNLTSMLIHFFYFLWTLSFATELNSNKMKGTWQNCEEMWARGGRWGCVRGGMVVAIIWIKTWSGYAHVHLLDSYHSLWSLNSPGIADLIQEFKTKLFIHKNHKCRMK